MITKERMEIFLANSNANQFTTEIPSIGDSAVYGTFFKQRVGSMTHTVSVCLLSDPNKDITSSVMFPLFIYCPMRPEKFVFDPEEDMNRYSFYEETDRYVNADISALRKMLAEWYHDVNANSAEAKFQRSEFYSIEYISRLLCQYSDSEIFTLMHSKVTPTSKPIPQTGLGFRDGIYGTYAKEITCDKLPHILKDCDCPLSLASYGSSVSGESRKDFLGGRTVPVYDEYYSMPNSQFLDNRISAYIATYGLDVAKIPAPCVSERYYVYLWEREALNKSKVMDTYKDIRNAIITQPTIPKTVTIVLDICGTQLPLSGISTNCFTVEKLDFSFDCRYIGANGAIIRTEIAQEIYLPQKANLLSRACNLNMLAELKNAILKAQLPVNGRMTPFYLAGVTEGTYSYHQRMKNFAIPVSAICAVLSKGKDIYRK